MLAELARIDALDAALVVLDEVGLERLLRAVATTHGGDEVLDVSQLLLIAVTLANTAAPPQGGGAASRRQAVRLWLQIGRHLPLRGVWHALRLLLRILEQPALLADARQAPLPDMPPWCRDVLQEFAATKASHAAPVLDELRRITPSAVPPKPGKPEQWVSSDCAAVLLLCDTIHRLRWMHLMREAGHPSRTAQAILAGILMRMLGVPPAASWEPGQPIDPAPGMLAGLPAEPDSHAVARVFAATPPAALLVGTAAADDWASVLDAAADALAAAFAARIRGFRKATRGSVVRHFLRRPGRILIEDTFLRAVLRPNPFGVALHMSGVDTPVHNVDWLGGRRMEFVLEGL
jgi:hypothetical protein